MYHPHSHLLIDDAPFPQVAEYQSLDTVPHIVVDSGKKSSRFFRHKSLKFLPFLLLPIAYRFCRYSSAIASPKNILLYSNDEWTKSFETFYRAYEKHQSYSFGSIEFMKRFEIYKDNLKRIHLHNERAKANKDDEESSYTLAPNQFADLTFNEFKDRHLKSPSSSEMSLLSTAHPFALESEILKFSPNATLPKSVNWFTKGCVTPVKDQAKCGSCWAFSSTGAIEGAVCAQTGELLSLSEQELVDCAGPEGEHGCNGGVMDRAFQYVIDQGGICVEEEYPYKATQGMCHRDHCQKHAKIDGYMRIPRESDRALRAAVAFYGPVAAGIEADRSAFQFYHQGVFTLPCGKKLNHAILVAGYGVDEKTGGTYWLVKNSWGATWGDKGYVKLARKGHHGGKAGECGILLSAVTPIVTSSS